MYVLSNPPFFDFRMAANTGAPDICERKKTKSILLIIRVHNEWDGGQSRKKVRRMFFFGNIIERGSGGT